jgi:hypothetical protein
MLSLRNCCYQQNRRRHYRKDAGDTYRSQERTAKQDTRVTTRKHQDTQEAEGSLNVISGEAEQSGLGLVCSNNFSRLWGRVAVSNSLVPDPGVVRTGMHWNKSQEKEVVGSLGSGLINLHLESVRNWLSQGQSFQGQISNHKNMNIFIYT